ncbi:hypothetical protein [Amaricoccus sp. W119]|uniref:hypothetical protein n=1 Tax=Amaricoccus sp. W119 TaxID=3391833 RepID=UPI0039A48995
MQMRTIEIDFDIHQMIELERKNFDEPENSALRRLLKLPNAKSEPPKSVAASELSSANRSWSRSGVELPHGTEVKMEYNGQAFQGVIEDGAWLVDGLKTRSPSDAAGSAARTKNGGRPSLNGWIYWEVKRPGDSRWRKLKSLKPR